MKFYGSADAVLQVRYVTVRYGTQYSTSTTRYRFRPVCAFAIFGFLDFWIFGFFHFFEFWIFSDLHKSEQNCTVIYYIFNIIWAWDGYDENTGRLPYRGTKLKCQKLNKLVLY